jgi:uncharacterized SAM-binding protein YcdF (DUF218 family)
MNAATATAIVWEYMQLRQPPQNADAHIVLGSRDDRVALHAARLVDRHQYDTGIVTCGAVPHNPKLHTWREQTEAAHFAALLVEHSNYGSKIVVEPEARHTSENATLSYILLQQIGIDLPNTIQLATKPYMERRAIATFDAQWPDKHTQFFVSSAPILLREYCNAEHSIDATVQVMLKDFQSLIDYPKHGWQTPQTIPSRVLRAVEYPKV